MEYYITKQYKVTSGDHLTGSEIRRAVNRLESSYDETTHDMIMMPRGYGENETTVAVEVWLTDTNTAASPQMFIEFPQVDDDEVDANDA